MNRKIYISFVVVLLFVLALFFIFPNDKKESYVEVAGKKVWVDVVRTHEERQLGLSGRVSLAEDEGMLFVFETSGRYPFWMKDMNFPIDIVWLSEDLKVVYIERGVTPESYPTMFDPGVDAKYVLEVIAGFSEKNNLQIGDVVKLN